MAMFNYGDSSVKKPTKVKQNAEVSDSIVTTQNHRYADKGLNSVFPTGTRRFLNIGIKIISLFLVLGLVYGAIYSLLNLNHIKSTIFNAPKTKLPSVTIDPTSFTQKPALQIQELGPKKGELAIYETLFAKSGPAGYAPVVIENRDAAGNLLKQRIEYLQKQKMQREIVNETGIFYPEDGSYYPIERARYPEFYKRCDLDGDGIVTLDELGNTQPIFTKITKKYSKGDVDSIVKEFITNKEH